jgi:hypothetical protein
VIRVPTQVEDAWEVIAAAWGWPPSEMSLMTLAEVMDWQARAEAQIKARVGKT